MKHSRKTKPKIKKVNALQWVLDLLADESSFEQRGMFGGQVGYLNGLLVACIMDREEPWSGLLIPTDRVHHPSLTHEWPNLIPHPVLGKWLYLSQSELEFEEVVLSIVHAMMKRDPRFGIEPGTRRRRRGEALSRGSQESHLVPKRDLPKKEKGKKSGPALGRISAKIRSGNA
jgi:hypothetical protein